MQKFWRALLWNSTEASLDPNVGSLRNTKADHLGVTMGQQHFIAILFENHGART